MIKGEGEEGGIDFYFSYKFAYIYARDLSDECLL